MPAEDLTTGRVVAIGEPDRLAGYALAGVEVLPARSAAAATAAWRALPAEVGLVLLTPRAAEALVESRDGPSAPLTVVMPQ